MMVKSNYLFSETFPKKITFSETFPGKNQLLTDVKNRILVLYLRHDLGLK
jgi:hypothetical protein